MVQQGLLSGKSTVWVRLRLANASFSIANPQLSIANSKFAVRWRIFILGGPLLHRKKALLGWCDGDCSLLLAVLKTSQRLQASIALAEISWWKPCSLCKVHHSPCADNSLSCFCPCFLVKKLMPSKGVKAKRLTPPSESIFP